MPAEWLLLTEITLISIAAGTFGAMVGLGGGLILVPTLITIFDVPDSHARFAGLVAVCVTSLSGSLVYLKEQVTDMTAASLLQPPTVIGAICGALLGSNLNTTILRLLFAAVLIFIAVQTLKKKTEREPIEPNRTRIAAAISACVLGGLISSLLGVGGGVVFVPVIAFILNRPQRVASATSTYLIALTAAGSGLIYAKSIPPSAISLVVLPAALGIFFGARFGAKLSGVVSELLLRRVLAVGVIANATLLIWKVVNSRA